MPQFRPSILVSDAYGSAGNTTWYHRDGKCYTRKRSHPVYGGTAGQLEHLDVHRRALAAWRTVPHSTQLVWNRLAAEVEPHRPPFDHRAHISGQNLLVSAYHGFFTLGDEHLPEPQRDSFPPFAIRLSDAIVGDTGVGVLSFACEDSTDGVFRVCFGIISLMNSVEQIRSTSGYPIMFPGPVPP